MADLHEIAATLRKLADQLEEYVPKEERSEAIGSSALRVRLAQLGVREPALSRLASSVTLVDVDAWDEYLESVDYPPEHRTGYMIARLTAGDVAPTWLYTARRRSAPATTVALSSQAGCDRFGRHNA